MTTTRSSSPTEPSGIHRDPKLRVDDNSKKRPAPGLPAPIGQKTIVREQRTDSSEMASIWWRRFAHGLVIFSLVIQTRVIFGRGNFPIQRQGDFRVTNGRPVRMKCTKASFSFSAYAVASVSMST